MICGMTLSSGCLTSKLVKPNTIKSIIREYHSTKPNNMGMFNVVPKTPLPPKNVRSYKSTRPANMGMLIKTQMFLIKPKPSTQNQNDMGMFVKGQASKNNSDNSDNKEPIIEEPASTESEQ